MNESEMLAIFEDGVDADPTGLSLDTILACARLYAPTKRIHVEWYPSHEDHDNHTVSADWSRQGEGPGSDVMVRLCHILELAGYTIEWGDRVAACGTCGKCVVVQPDTTSWTPGFVVAEDEGDITCAECAECVELD